MRQLRVFVCGVMASHELDRDRLEAIEAINSLGAPFESSSYNHLHEHGPHEPRNHAFHRIAGSDILILLAARRLSPFVVAEFDYARHLGMPCFVFVRDGESRSHDLETFIQGCGLPVHTYQMGVLFASIQAVLREMAPWSEQAEAVLVHTTGVWTHIIEGLMREPERVRQLTPRKFEELIAELVAGLGYDVELTKATSDRGFDIIARRTDDPVFPSVHLIEAKLWTPPRKVGEPVLRSVYGAGMARNCNGVMIVTPSAFSRNAERFVSDFNLRQYIRLVDGAQLAALYGEYMILKRDMGRDQP